MNKIAKPSALLLICMALLLGACASAPQPSPAPLLADSDRSQMMAALAASAEAWNRGDLRGHLALYDPAVTTMTKINGPRPGVATLEAALRAAYFNGDQPRQNLRMGQVVLRPLSAGSALMTGRFALQGGGLAEQSGWFTLIWVRQASGWLVVHDHAS